MTLNKLQTTIAQGRRRQLDNLDNCPNLKQALDDMTAWTINTDIKCIEHQVRKIEKWHELDEKQENTKKSKPL